MLRGGSPRRAPRSTLKQWPEYRGSRNSVQNFLVDDVVADGFAVGRSECSAPRRSPCGRPFAGDAGDVRRGDEVGQGQERIILRRRLLVKDVERGTGDAVGPQRVDPFGNGFDLIEFSGSGYDNLQR